MSPLYKRILGEQYEKLPKAVQALHDYEGEVTYRGSCNVERGSNALAHLCADILSLPKAGDDVDVKVTFRQEADKEHWKRSFAGKPFHSLQWQKEGVLYERLNFTTLIFNVIATEEKLSLELKGVRILGIPVIAILRPKVVAQESERGDKFCFTIRTIIPLLGLLVAYQGTLEKVR